ncbi:hypothetical protein M8C21_005337, partial [Ambrosia artemisiifolia]
ITVSPSVSIETQQPRTQLSRTASTYNNGATNWMNLIAMCFKQYARLERMDLKQIALDFSARTREGKKAARQFTSHLSSGSDKAIRDKPYEIEARLHITCSYLSFSSK